MSFDLGLSSTRTLFFILLLDFTFVPGYGLAHDHDLQMTPEESGDRIALEFKNTYLQIALDEIHQKSGIAFKVPEEFKNRTVNISVSESNWIEAVKSVLRDYDIVELGGPELSTTQIWLVGAKQGGHSEKASHSPKNTVIPRFKFLARFPPGMSLPPMLFEDPKIQAFLQENGIHSREGWKDFRRARQVREKARQHLEQLLSQNTLN